MIHLKKLLLIGTFLLLSLGLASCGNTDKTNEKQMLGEAPADQAKTDKEQDTTANNSLEEAGNGSADTSAEENNYEIVQTKSEDKFPVLFVTVPEQNTDTLTPIAQELKSEYPSSDYIGVTVIFFTDDYRQEAIDDNSDNAFAKLTVNYKDNVSKLIFFNDQKPIHIE